DGVPDIDADDQGNPQLCAEYSKDIFEYLVSLEVGTSQSELLLDKTPFTIPKAGSHLCVVSFQIFFKSKFEMFENFGLKFEVFDFAESVPHSKLQLVGTASMLLSAKYEEMYTPAVDDFVYVTDGACGKRDVRDTSRTCYRNHRAGLSPPVFKTNRFAPLPVAQVDKVQHSLAKYILELSLLCYELSWVHPSEQAAAALCLSLKLWGKDWDPTLTHYGRYSQAQLVPTMAVMAAIVLDADKSKFTVGY
ncbi:G2/mitotic-specific cyclin A, putative, partial [Ixodes scapularis]